MSDSRALERFGYAVGGILMDEHPAEALPAFQIFERWAPSELGRDHPAVPQAVARQAWCLARLGRHADACAQYDRALEMLRSVVGEDHPACDEIREYVTSRCGAAARNEGEQAPAEAAGPHTLSSLPRFNPLGAGGDPAESVHALEAVVQAVVRRLGIAAPFIPVDLDDDSQAYTAGKFFREIGEFELAAELFQEYERWASENYGPEHDYVIQALHQIGYCRWELGEFTEACRVKQRTIDLLRKKEPDNPYIRVLEEDIDGRCPPMPERLLFGVADQLLESDRPEQAAAALEAYERWAEREYGAEGRYVVEAMTMRAECYERLGFDGDACELYRQVLDSVHGLGWDAASVEGIAKFIAEHCEDVPAREAPRVSASSSVPLGERWVSPPLAEIEPDLESIGDALVREHHYEEAVVAYQASQAWLERLEGPDGPSVPTLLAKRAWCHVEIGQEELACRLYERAVRLAELSKESDQEFLRSASKYLEKNCR